MSVPFPPALSPHSGANALDNNTTSLRPAIITEQSSTVLASNTENDMDSFATPELPNNNSDRGDVGERHVVRPNDVSDT